MKRGNGEFALIDTLHDILGPASSGLDLGIGDDTAILTVDSHRQILVTTDALVEGVHFDRRYTPMESLGWKSLAASISDIAAMGGIPQMAVVSLAIGPGWTETELTALYSGLKQCSEVYHCPIGGGDTTRSLEGTFINVAVIGSVKHGCAVTRSGARAGDWIGVTRALGGSRCGFEALGLNRAEAFPESAARFLRPQPSVEDGLVLALQLGASAMIDISDGLGSELHHICEQSAVGCRVDAEAIPVTEEAARRSAELDLTPWAYALESGEEYCLLFTCPPPEDSLIQAVGERLSVHWIGRITSDAGRLILKLKNREIDLERRGWDHFSE